LTISCARLRLRQDDTRAVLGRLHDLGLRQAPLDLALRLVQELRRLHLGQVQHLFLMLHHVAGVVDLARDGDAHAVDKVEEALAIDDGAAADGQLSGLGGHLFQAVNQVQDIHMRPVLRSEAGDWMLGGPAALPILQR
jgi:hypothetical protein